MELPSVGQPASPSASTSILGDITGAEEKGGQEEPHHEIGAPAAEETLPTTAAWKTKPAIVIGSLGVIAVVAVAWFFSGSAEARLMRAVDRGELFYPEGESAYDLYNQLKGKGLSADTINRLRQQVLPRLTVKGESLLQKRMEGITLTESEREELVRLYGWAVGLAPKDPRMQARYNYVLGYGAFLVKKYSEALRFFQESVKYDGNWAPAFNDLGRTYVKLKDFYHAEQGYRKAVAADPNWVFPQLNLAGIYLRNKQWTLAEQAYRKVTRMDTAYATPWYFLGQVYEGQNQSWRAINAYERAVQLAAARPSSAFRVASLQRHIQELRSNASLTSRYAVRLFNCDDSCELVLNRRRILTSGFGEDKGFVDISRQLISGRNLLVFNVINRGGAITYGLQVTKNNVSIFRQVCGQAYVRGCENNRTMPIGVARQFAYTLVK